MLLLLVDDADEYDGNEDKLQSNCKSTAQKMSVELSAKVCQILK